MSRKLFAFLLSELKTVRVICQRKECGAVTEVTLDRMQARFAQAACPVCNHDLLPPFSGADNPLTRLAKAVRELQDAAVTEKVQIEFVVPDADAE